MPPLSGSRIRDNGVFGTTTDNPLSAGATTFNSNELSLLSQVSGDHAIITLDPTREFGNPEIIIVTAHTVAATIATITRGAYGTSARSHPQGTSWVHAPVDEDFIEVVTSGTRPTNTYNSQTIFETDTNRYVGRSTAGVWQQHGLFFDPPACRVYNNAAQGIVNSTFTNVTFNSERFDTDNMHSLVTNPERITINTPGIYVVTACIEWAPDNDYGSLIETILLNGTTAIAYHRDDNPAAANPISNVLSAVYKFAASDYITVFVRQINTSAATNNINSVGNYSPEFAATWIGRGDVI